MDAAGVAPTVRRRSAGKRLADLFYGRPRLQAGALLSGPLAWLVIVAAVLMGMGWLPGQAT